jgi:ferritin-like metal-binding protein YciE
MNVQTGNVGPIERWLSLIGGAALTLAALGRGGLLRRAALGATGASLMIRGSTGYCAVKGALAGETSVRDGLSEQWSRLKSGMRTSAAAEIGNMETLFVEELQELHSAEIQLYGLIDRLASSIANVELERLLQGYDTEMRSRAQDLARILKSRGVDPRAHPDQAMRALINETRKMAEVCANNVRDAAVIASIQRILHYKIAAYGSVATYGKLLGSVQEAARLAEYADRDKAVDQELTMLATQVVNPTARSQPDTSAGAAAASTTH